MSVVLDIETDAIDATKIHCIVAYDIESKKPYTFVGDECYVKFPNFARSVSQFVMHNGISFDAPVNSVEFSHDGKDLTIAGKSRFIDTIDIRTLKSRFKIREEALKIDKICYLDEREFAYVKDSESVKIWGEYGKRRENYFKTNNFTNFKSVKVISDIHRIMQLKTDKLNKMTIVGLNL